MSEDKKSIIFEADLKQFESEIEDMKNDIDDFDVCINPSKFGKVITFVHNNEVKAQMIIYGSEENERLNKINEEIPMEQEEDHRRFLTKVSLKNFISYLMVKNNIQSFKITTKSKNDELIDVKRISINYKDKCIILE